MILLTTADYTNYRQGDITPMDNSVQLVDLGSNTTGRYNCSVQQEAVLNRTPVDQRQLNAFWYIIIVLSFYAISMVLLMIKYIRREEEEVSLDHYYAEFVKREQFQSATIKNKLALQRDRHNISKALKVLERQNAISVIFESPHSRDNVVEV